jgi:hypothetical protein
MEGKRVSFSKVLDRKTKKNKAIRAKIDVV